MENKSGLMEIPGRWEISYRYSAGGTASHFFREIRDSKRILGTRCPTCHRVLLPPRSFCERCFVKIEEWVEVGHQGKITAHTIVPGGHEGMTAPRVMALVKLDGADTSILNLVVSDNSKTLDELAKEIEIGTAVEVVFKPQREGRVTDFYFSVI